MNELLFAGMNQHPMVLEAQAWKHFRVAGVGDRGPFALTAIRMSGACWRADGHGGNDDLRRLAETLGHRPPNLFQATEHGFVRRFLPLYGEGPNDDARRALDHMPNFGSELFRRRGYAWFLNPKMSADPLFLFFWFVDMHMNAYAASLREVRGLLDAVGGVDIEDMDGLSEAEAKEWLSLALEYTDDFRDILDMAVAGWSKQILGAQPQEHSCGVTPIALPEAGGVYFIRSRAPSDWAIKIGWGKNIRKRVGDLQTAHPWPLELLAFVPNADLAAERAYHEKFRELRLLDAPGREWFRYEHRLVAEIVSLREDLAA